MADQYKFLAGGKSNIPLIGNDDEVKTQLSLLLGFGQLLDSEVKGLSLDFYDFIKLFEEGFVTGFAAKQNVELNKKYWGQTLKTRPKVRVIQESSKAWQEKGYAVIELLPDRTIENESYLLFGTPAMLIQQVMYWMNYHRNKGANVSVGGGNSQRLPVSVTGQCFVKLRFYGRSQGGKRHFVYKSFRWVKVNPQTVKQQDVTNLANNIKNKFDNFKFTTGHKSFTYNRPDQGFNRVWGHFKDRGEAMRLFEQALDLQRFRPDWSHLTESEVIQPGTRFRSPAEKILQAGVLIRAQEERPIATVSFNGAFIKFPHIKDEGVLVDSQGRVMDIAKFLAPYQD